MKLIRKTIAFLLIVLLSFILIGCANCIATNYDDVDVTVVEEYHRGIWLQPVRVGNVTIFVTHPAEYQITVSYNDVDYTINDKDTYDKYKDKIGQVVKGKLETKTYDNGTAKYNIVSLE